MFLRNNEMLTFPGENLHPAYQRYNQLARGLSAYKLGKMTVDDFYRQSEFAALNDYSRRIEFSVWRITDKNINAQERGIDNTPFTITKPDGERVSYVIVPRMNTDKSDPYPLEYTERKDPTFEDINDPRMILIARSYKGVIAEIAKDYVFKYESALRQDYKFLADPDKEIYCSSSNRGLIKAITKEGVKMFEPNFYEGH